jgi:hypothetical protein
MNDKKRKDKKATFLTPPFFIIIKNGGIQRPDLIVKKTKVGVANEKL